MKDLVLNEMETKELEKEGVVEIERNGFDIVVEKAAEWEDEPYIITIINPFENVKLTKETKKQSNKKAKLEVGKVYKVDYIDEYGNKDFFIGEYEGIDTDEYNSIPCLVCGAETHKRGHLFNSFYSENGYESFWIGTSCIKKCVITESTREKMLNQ